MVMSLLTQTEQRFMMNLARLGLIPPMEPGL
jgi:hypothetical protein